MSEISDIVICDRAPAPPADQGAFHQDLVDAFNREAGLARWKGVKFTAYSRDPETHQVVIYAEPGISGATLNMLRTISRKGKGS